MNPSDEELSQRRRAARARADRTLCVDVDDTLCFTDDHDYTKSRPNDPVVAKVREAKAKGWWIILHTARGMGRSGGHIETVADEVVDEVQAFCVRHDIPYDEIVVGKPWARWYIDDRALRPDEFTELEL